MMICVLDGVSGCHEARVCSWDGPGNVHVSNTDNVYTDLHVLFNTSTCQCHLVIVETVLHHAGVWSCRQENVTIGDSHLDLDTTVQPPVDNNEDSQVLIMNHYFR